MTDAVYKGLAIASTHDLLYAANFHAGTVDVFDSHVGLIADPVSGPRPVRSAGYAPFNIQNLRRQAFT